MSFARVELQVYIWGIGGSLLHNIEIKKECSRHKEITFRITYRPYVTWPRAQPGRGAMWRSGAPQRRVARGTPKGCRCTYVLLCAVPFRIFVFCPVDARFRPGEEIHNCRGRVRTLLEWRG